MPIALYYKALLSEYSPEPQVLGQREVLHFYSDYPYEKSREIWYRLYREFGDSPESVEARWRIAKHWAGQGRFEQVDGLLVEAQGMAAERLKSLEKEARGGENIFSLFRAPADSVMTEFKLTDLQRKLNQLRILISAENKTSKPESAKRLAEFVMLNPHSSDYAERLDVLLEQMGKNDPLRDNILLAQVKLVADERLRAEKLSRAHRDFADVDGGMQALYELALLKIHFWRQQSDENPEQKRGYLADARATLNSFISLYPEGMCIEQVKKNLEDLPTAD
jgi:hypothetical protein